MKPDECPFCDYDSFVQRQKNRSNQDIFWCECKRCECGARGPVHAVEEKAVIAWNRANRDCLHEIPRRHCTICSRRERFR